MRITKEQLKRIILEELNEIEDELAGKTAMRGEPYEDDDLSGPTVGPSENPMGPDGEDELSGKTSMAADEPDMEKHIRRSKAFGKVTQVLQKLLSELT